MANKRFSFVIDCHECPLPPSLNWIELRGNWKTTMVTFSLHVFQWTNWISLLRISAGHLLLFVIFDVCVCVCVWTSGEVDEEIGKVVPTRVFKVGWNSILDVVCWTPPTSPVSLSFSLCVCVYVRKMRQKSLMVCDALLFTTDEWGKSNVVAT